MSELFRSQVEMFTEPKQGTVTQTIAPYQRGRVKAMGSYWPAEFYQANEQKHLPPDAPILIVGIRDITLLVIPVS
jgi:membrane protein implicated in regulation of membrane protease activity